MSRSARIRSTFRMRRGRIRPQGRRSRASAAGLPPARRRRSDHDEVLNTSAITAAMSDGGASMRRNSLHRSVGRSKNVEKNSLWPVGVEAQQHAQPHVVEHPRAPHRRRPHGVPHRVAIDRRLGTGVTGVVDGGGDRRRPPGEPPAARRRPSSPSPGGCSRRPPRTAPRRLSLSRCRKQCGDRCPHRDPHVLAAHGVAEQLSGWRPRRAASRARREIGSTAGRAASTVSSTSHPSWTGIE